MTSNQQPQVDVDDAVEAGVIEYLLRNPRFLERHPELLAELQIPHPCGAAVSLLEHQARVLRERGRTLQARLDQLLEVARDNDRLADRIHRLTLELMEAQNLDGMVFCLKDELRSNFQCDVVAVKLFGDGEPAQDWVRPNATELRAFSGLMQDPRPLCGRLVREQLEFLFGDSATAIGSAALVPLIDGRVLGLLAVGSYRPDRFHPGMGTVFLRQLGATAGRALRRYLTP
jgi:uncharacterized protein YigA (DUF484 family)